MNQAVADLKQLYSICNIKVGDSQYQTVPEGTAWLNQSWSGDPLSAYFYYLPKGTPASVMSYWKAPNGHVPVQNDCWSICTTTKKPVLSHLWLNYILDNDVAYSNFVNFNGYQPPLNEIDPADLVTKNVIPENLQTAVLTNDDFGPDSLQEMTLTNTGSVLWQNGYSELPGGLARCIHAGCGRDSRFPGVLWLILLFIVPFYAVIGGRVRLGRPDALHRRYRPGTRSTGTSAG